MMLIGFLYVSLAGLVFILIIGLRKLIQYIRSEGETGEKEKKEGKKKDWRTEVARMGSAAGLVVTYFVIAITLSFFLNKEIGQALVKNPILWSLPVALLLFYGMFRMGVEIPVWFFKGVNIAVVVGYIFLIIFTTARAVNPDFLKPKPNDKQTHQTDSFFLGVEIVSSGKQPESVNFCQQWTEVLPNGKVCLVDLPKNPTGEKWRVLIQTEGTIYLCDKDLNKFSFFGSIVKRITADGGQVYAYGNGKDVAKVKAKIL